MPQTELDQILAAHARRSARSEAMEARVRTWFEKTGRREATAKAKDGVLELSMLDVIGADWWSGGGITSQWVSDQLKTNKDAKSIKVLMNSPGGDAFEGLAIQNLLKRTGATVSVEVVGMAASAASVIAMAGSTIAMHEGSMMMVHEAWTITSGTAGDMRDAASFLEKVDSSILDIYSARTGRNRHEIALLVAAETWFTAAEAVDGKFATSIIPASGAPASARAQTAVASASGAPSSAVEPRAGLSRFMH